MARAIRNVSAARNKAHDEGEWVRDAAMAYAAKKAKQKAA